MEATSLLLILCPPVCVWVHLSLTSRRLLLFKSLLDHSFVPRFSSFSSHFSVLSLGVASDRGWCMTSVWLGLTRERPPVAQWNASSVFLDVVHILLGYKVRGKWGKQKKPSLLGEDQTDQHVWWETEWRAMERHRGHEGRKLERVNLVCGFEIRGTPTQSVIKLTACCQKAHRLISIWLMNHPRLLSSFTLTPFLF